MSTIEFNTHMLQQGRALQYFALSLTSNREDANDLVQDTFLKALVNKDKFTDANNLKAWLYTIMKNTFINNYRRLVRGRQFMESEADARNLLTEKKSSDNPVSNITVKEIELSVKNLEDEIRVPFTMHFEGYKYKEIADHLNMPIGTVKSRIFMARKKLSSMVVETV